MDHPITWKFNLMKQLRLMKNSDSFDPIKSDLESFINIPINV